MVDEDKPAFLHLGQYHLSRELAHKAVVRTLIACGVECPKAGWHSVVVNWNDKSSAPSRFADLVNEARGMGIVKRLQDYLDQKDTVFGGTIRDISTPNWQMKIRAELAGFSKEANGPCRTSQVEIDLTDDILHFRQAACDGSNQHDFRVTCRAFRSYLSACTSLIDAFINRHILLAKHDGFQSEAFDKLKVVTKLEDRVQLWFEVCSSKDPSSFFRSKEWCHFQEIRKSRNEILHATEPIGVYSIQEIQLALNKVRTGIGGLLLHMRSAHEKPTLGFIERLRTAPLVDFVKIQFVKDGHRIIKRVQGT